MDYRTIKTIMLATIASYIEYHHLLPTGGTVVVAVSGGADSLCLLHILNRLCGEGKRYPRLALHVAHLDHKLRGDEGERDAVHVAHIARAWDVPVTTGEVAVPALAQEMHLSLEEAARIARYRFLRDVAQGQPIAVAHHADDQVETLLLHLLRGGGLSGMVGMLPRREDIIRPLLVVHRSDILAYCRQHHIEWREDTSNTDLHYLRNRVRHELVPLMESMNPAIRATLLRNMEVVRVDMHYIEAQVDAIWSNVVISEQDNLFILSVSALLALPLSLQRHLLQRITARLCEGQSPLEPRHYTLIEHFLQRFSHGGEQRTLQLPARMRLVHTLNTIHIFREQVGARTLSGGEVIIAPPFSASTQDALLSIPGHVTVTGTPWLATAEMLPVDIVQAVLPALAHTDWAQVWQLLPSDRHTVYIDGDTVDAVLTVRTRHPGDRIRPLGMAHEKKVQDILVDEHIARAGRGTIPLFFSAGRCIWVGGICITDSVRLTSATRRIVRLSITPSS